MSRYFLGSVPRDDPSPTVEEDEDSASDWSAATPTRPRENIPSSEQYESSDGHISCILSPLDRNIVIPDQSDEPPIPVVLDPTEILLRRYRPESFNNSAASSAANSTTAKVSSADSESNNTSNFTNNLANNTTVTADDPFVDAVCSTPKGGNSGGRFEETTPTRAPPVPRQAEESYKLSSSPPKATTAEKLTSTTAATATASIEGLSSQLDILDDLDDDDIDFALTQHTQKKNDSKPPPNPVVKKETATPVLKDIEDLQKMRGSPVKLSKPSLGSRIPPLVIGVKKVDVKSFIDDLEDEDFDSDLELEFTQLQAKKKPRLQASRYKLVTDHVMSQRTHKENALPVEIDYKRDDVLRFRIVEVEESSTQIALVVEDNKAQQQRVALRGCWMRAVPCVGDICHLIDESSSDEMDLDFEMDFDYVVDDMKGDMLFILNPDTLVTCTAVAEAHQCTRNVVLKNKMQGPRGIGSIFALLGVIIHETIQMCFGAVRYDAEFVESCAETVTKANMDGVMLSGESYESVLAKIKDRLPSIVGWFKEYMRQTPSAVAIENRTGKKRTLAITKVVDVEEEIWSPRYGIKGKIDATIEVREGHHRYLVPLEVKTGKSTTHIPHRSQTALYTLMLHDRYSCPINFGVLYYSAASETLVIPAVKDEIHNLLAIRNEVASFMRQGSRDMPDVIYDQGQCDRCFQKSECMVYYRLYDTYVKESRGEDGGATANKARFLQETEHVTEKDSQFFNHWDSLLAKEGSDTAVLKREVWTMLSKDREKEGRCFSSLVIDKVEQNATSMWYTFKSPDGSEIPYASVNISPGDRVVISDEAGHYCLAMGTLLGSSSETVRCALDRRLEFSLQKLQGFRSNDNQVFRSMLTHSSQSHEAPINFRFRVDRDDFAFGLGVARNNLFSLFAKHLSTDESPQKIEQLRSWIVDLAPPQPVAGEPTMKLGKLNSDQTKAVHHIMNCKDYSLLLGMPGTGKTTTIAEIIMELVKNGKTVLLSSFTHSAVDNILLKLMQHPSCNFDMLRLGSTSKIHPEVAERYAANSRRDYETREEFEKLFLAPPVVGATALGVGDWVLQERHFDYCIVDEASQITLPFSLGPIRYADKFVLVGDHYQLTPIVKHPEAAGLRESLFKILCDAHPTEVVNLGIQYRMCADIMLLSNTLVYDGKLTCGNDEVANQSLAVPQLSKLRTLYADGLPNDDYLGHVLDPKQKVIFLNTDLVPAQETVAGDRVHNPTEAVIVGQVVEALCLCGVEDSQIGCISQYRAQLKLINKELALRSGIEVMTADKFQGRDKDCIVVSLVRSNNEQRVGDLLKDWRRLNVAFTRSRSKLIVIGSRATLESFDLLKEFLRLIDDNGWMYSLPKDCTKMYSIAKQGTSPRKKQKRVGLSQRLIDNRPIMKNILEGL